MKIQFRRSRIPVIGILVAFLFLSVDVARAEVQYVQFDSEARWTLIWCALILAIGMVAAAAILRRPK